MSHAPVQTDVVLQEKVLAAYEDLRGQILGRPDASWVGVGLAVMVRQGMAAWMEALSQPVASVSERVREQYRPGLALPLDLRAEATRILTAMAVGNLQGAGR